MPDHTLLCSSPTLGKVTVATFRSWERQRDNGWSKKPMFIRDRLRERYIDPVEKLAMADKNGFMIMALSCLLIESMEALYQGWASTKDKSKQAFLRFFERQPRFKAIHDAGRGEDFYLNVRCGILHQGETNNGWTVVRNGPMFDGNKRLNATAFHRALASALDDYCRELECPQPGNQVRKRFNQKMKAILDNCQ
jgi:hypothetical protein